MLDLAFWLPVMLGGTVAGATCGTVGVYVVGMRLPFLAVFVAHAALAGAVFGSLLGLEGKLVLLPALASAVLSAVLLGVIDPRRSRINPDTLMGVLFSVSMGVAFLGIGMFPVLGRSDNDIRNLLWGSLAFCRWSDVTVMLATAVGTWLFVALFAKELRAILFCRQQAAAAGIHVGIVWSGFLVLAAIVLTVNFQAVGGLMIYSLLTCPATAAFQLSRGHRASIFIASLVGAACGLLGFLLSAWLDLPSGATTVLLAGASVGLAATGRAVLQLKSPSAT